jgi:peptide/nickel transport system permease protein
MSSDPLQAAQAALQRGERIHARKLARMAILQNPRSEAAWLLMARVVDVPEQVIDCLEQALKINPQNQSTMRALRALRRQAERGPAIAVQARPAAPPRREQVMTTPPVERAARPALQARPRVTALPLKKKIRAPHRMANWSLIIGSLLVFLVLVIGVVGSALAPADPLEEHTIIKIGDDWKTPPFAPFAVPGFLLGSDQFGRDLLSRILWGVRPTLSMVATVAVVRLLLGTLIGLGAGWFRNRFGRWLDTLISAALSVPVLIVALGAIAMLGAEIGLLAFIVGLSINGWAETARIVRDQTQTIKGQPYIEAAQALGASTFTILSRHILRQVMPMVWMLFAFEISNTLMTTAGLGFLGYYIGGDVWVEVSDFVSRRISGMPELGQMLATSWVNLVQPWPLVITGSIVFVAVLGFNLMGEGLRSRLNPELINRNSLTSRFGRWFSAWFEQRVTYPSGVWLRRSPLHPVMVTVMVLGLAGILYATKDLLAGGASSTALNMPGGHYWVAERGDPYGSRSTEATGPSDPQVLWTVHSSQGFSGGPAVAADGTLYLPLVEGKLLALDPDGATLWETQLPDSPIGSPALASDGTVVLAGSSGGVYAVSSSGALLWTYQPAELITAYSKVSHGPIVSRDGVIYTLIEDNRADTLLALDPQGQLLWHAPTGTRMVDVQPRLSPDNDFIFVRNVMLNAEDGSLVDLTLPSSEDSVLAGREQYVVGADGLLYLHAGHYLIQWQPGPLGFEIVQAAEWNYRGAGYGQASSFPVDAGTTRNGNLWLFYNALYGGTQLVWLDPSGKTLGISSSPLTLNSQMVAVDGGNTAYLCGMTAHGETAWQLRCQAFAEGSEEPTWDMLLDEQMQDLLGSALVPGRLYLTTSAGALYALGDVEEGSEP